MDNKSAQEAVIIRTSLDDYTHRNAKNFRMSTKHFFCSYYNITHVTFSFGKSLLLPKKVPQIIEFT